MKPTFCYTCLVVITAVSRTSAFRSATMWRDPHNVITRDARLSPRDPLNLGRRAIDIGRPHNCSLIHFLIARPLTGNVGLVSCWHLQCSVLNGRPILLRWMQLPRGIESVLKSASVSHVLIRIQRSSKKWMTLIRWKNGVDWNKRKLIRR